MFSDPHAPSTFASWGACGPGATPEAQAFLPGPPPEGLGAYEMELREAERLFLEEQSLAAKRLVTRHRAILRQALSGAPAGLAAHRGPPAIPRVPSTLSNLSQGTEESREESSVFLDPEDTPGADADRCTLQGIVGSQWFEITTALLVLAYCLSLGVQVHHETTTALGTKSNVDDVVVDNLPNVFRFLVCAYCVEMALRVAAEGRKFLCGRNRAWNAMDLCILAVSVLDLCILASEEVVINILGGFRVLRNLRFLRNLRLIALLRYFPDLRKMLWAIASCARSFLWGMALLFIMFYLFALYLMESALNILRAEPKPSSDIVKDLRKYWDGLYRAMLSLVIAVSGGEDWAEVGRPFLDADKWYACVFTGFIFISVFGTLNVMVGVFVQKSGEIENWDSDLALQESDRHHQTRTQTLQQLFRTIAADDSIYVDGDGNISVRDLMKRVIGSGKDNHIVRYFRHLGIHIEAAADEIILIFDPDGDGMMSEGEFVRVCRRLQGSAVPAQLEHLNRKLDDVRRELRALLDGQAM